MLLKTIAAVGVALLLVMGVPRPTPAKTEAGSALKMILIDPSLTDDALLSMIQPVTEEDVDALIAGLTGPLEVCRVKAAVLLGKIRAAKSVEPLAAAVKAETVGLPAAAAEALVAIGIPAIDQLSDLVHDPSVARELRARTMTPYVETLVAVGLPAFERLSAVVHDPLVARESREKAMGTILGFDDSRAAAFLGGLLRDPVPDHDVYKVAEMLGGRDRSGIRELVYANLGIGVDFRGLEWVRDATGLVLRDLSRREVLETCFAPLLNPGESDGADTMKRSALLAYGMGRFADFEGSKERVVKTEAPYIIACVRIAFLPAGEDLVVLDAATTAVRILRERGILEGGEGEFPRLNVQLQLQGYRAVQEQLEALAKEVAAREAPAPGQ